MRSNFIGTLLIATFSLTRMPVAAQAEEKDSLRTVLASDIPDSIRVNTLNALSRDLFSDSPDSSVSVADSARELAEQIHFLPGLALALKNMGIGYYLQSDFYTDAINSWQQALEIYQQLGDKVGVANMLSNQGAVYANQSDYVKSLDLHLQSLKISEEVNDTLRIITSLNNVGAIYVNKPETYDTAQQIFLKSYKLSQAIQDKYLVGTSTANLGELYYKTGDDEKALYFLKQSVKAYEGTEDLPYPLNYIGRVYVRQRKFDEAIETHKKAVEIATRLNTSLDLTQSLVALAQAYQAKGDIKLAIQFYNKAVDVGTPINAWESMKEAYEGLSKTYYEQSDFSRAYKYEHLLSDVKDQLNSIENKKQLNKLAFGYDLGKKETEIRNQQQRVRQQKQIRNGFIGGFVIVALFAGVFLKQRNRIGIEKKRSDRLLLNILPEETAEELKETGEAKTKHFESVSVLFTDFKNFTYASEQLTPQELVAEINHCYCEFDRIVTRYGIEKIKTIGDSYMCAGGLPVPNDTHPVDVVAAAIEMARFIEENKKHRMSKGQPYFEIRIGVHTGPVVAGIVGIKKFAYDIWGDTVNTASRMESSGQIGKVNISGTTYELVKDRFTCTYRGKVTAKNKGMIDMYFLEC